MCYYRFGYSDAHFRFMTFGNRPRFRIDGVVVV